VAVVSVKDISYHASLKLLLEFEFMESGECGNDFSNMFPKSGIEVITSSLSLIMS